MASRGVGVGLPFYIHISVNAHFCSKHNTLASQLLIC